MNYRNQNMNENEKIAYEDEIDTIMVRHKRLNQSSTYHKNHNYTETFIMNVQIPKALMIQFQFQSNINSCVEVQIN